MPTPVNQRKPPADRAASRFEPTEFDAIVVVSFGGPEGPDDVMPFLENVTRGRGVPRERLLDVAHHYELFGGVSPINEQNRELIAALEPELRAHGIDLPVYFGNRNWHPFLTDTMRQMRDDGVRRALAFLTSAFSSYSGCRQYRENLFVSQEAVGPDAPEVARLRMLYNHPGFVAANADRVRAALAEVPAGAHIAFTAHSIPVAMAKRCAYEAQLRETARLVAEAAGVADWEVVYQSRSGSPQMPWLEPDVCDHLEALHARGVESVVVSPIGFVSDHLEVLFDLDVEAREAAERLGLVLARAGTAGTHPAFVSAIREAIAERLTPDVPRRAVGRFGPSHDTCAPDCCLPGSGRPSPWDAEAPAGASDSLRGLMKSVGGAAVLRGTDTARPRGPLASALRRMRRDRATVAALIALGVILLISLFGGAIATRALGHSGDEPFPYATDGSGIYSHAVGLMAHIPDTPNANINDYGLLLPPPKGTPSTVFVLGGDGPLGRDELIRFLDGGRTSLEIGLGGVIFALLLAIPIGSLAGYFGGFADALVSRLTETIMAFPMLLFLIFATVHVSPHLRGVQYSWLLPEGVFSDALLIGVFTAFYPTRLIRQQVIVLRQSEWVDAAHMIGSSDWRILRRDLVPHLVPTMLIWGAIAVATNILLEVSLSFIGVGVQPFTPTWGSLLSEAWGTIYTPRSLEPTIWQTIVPTAGILVTVVSLNQISEGVRRALEPWARR